MSHTITFTLWSCTVQWFLGQLTLEQHWCGLLGLFIHGFDFVVEAEGLQHQATLFCMRDLSHCRFWCLQGSWDSYPVDVQGQLKLWGSPKLYVEFWLHGGQHCSRVNSLLTAVAITTAWPSLDYLSSPWIPHFWRLLVRGVPVSLTGTWNVYIQMSIFPSRYPTRHCILVRAFESFLHIALKTILHSYILSGEKACATQICFLGTCKSALITEVLQKGESCLIRFWGKVR